MFLPTAPRSRLIAKCVQPAPTSIDACPFKPMPITASESRGAELRPVQGWSGTLLQKPNRAALLWGHTVLKPGLSIAQSLPGDSPSTLSISSLSNVLSSMYPAEKRLRAEAWGDGKVCSKQLSSGLSMQSRICATETSLKAAYFALPASAIGDCSLSRTESVQYAELNPKVVSPLDLITKCHSVSEWGWISHCGSPLCCWSTRLH